MAEVTTAVLAKEHGISERTARRWLVQCERADGPSVVARRGRKLVTTRKAIAHAIPDARDQIRDEERIRALEGRVDELEEGVETTLAMVKKLICRVDMANANNGRSR